MARTDEDKIAEIIELDDSISLTPFITIANSLVTELLEDTDHDEDRLTLIETWLAAHFYTVRDPRATSESAGGVSEGKQMYTGAYLAASEYGQTAMVLDTSGTLNKLNQDAIEGAGKKKGLIQTLMTDEDRRYYGASTE